LDLVGGLFSWEFEKGGREVEARVEGRFVFYDIGLGLKAASAGLGLAQLAEDEAPAHLAEGRLVRVLGDWRGAFSGRHLYYPSRRQPAPAFAPRVDALRSRDRRPAVRK
jgi:DNA-binding transcriptional LysR family regulator